MESFYKEPTLETLNSFKKKELSEVAAHYDLEVPENASKVDIKVAVKRSQAAADNFNEFF